MARKQNQRQQLIDRLYEEAATHEESVAQTVNVRNHYLKITALSLLVIADLLVEETKDGGFFRQS